MCKKIIFIFVLLLSFSINNTFAGNTYETKDSLGNTRIVDRDTGEVVKTIGAAEKGGNEHIDAANRGDWNAAVNGGSNPGSSNNPNPSSSSPPNEVSKSNTTSNPTSSNAGSSGPISSADYQKGIDAANQAIKDAKTPAEKANAESALKSYEDAYNKASSKEKEAARDTECASSGDCIDKANFAIDTSLFSIGGNSLKGSDSKTTINNTLGNIIQKLMIALGVIALFVMTIGAGYMILYHGQDEYLSKGKNIFMGGITALVAALCSYYLVNLVGYILYK